MAAVGGATAPRGATLLRRIPEGVMSADPWGGWQAFHDAAHSYFENAAKASASGAAQQFSHFLREQFAASEWTQPRVVCNVFGLMYCVKRRLAS